MIFGLPVLPPVIAARQYFATIGGCASADSDWSIASPAGMPMSPATLPALPITALGRTRSMQAASSASVVRSESGSGVAPSFHSANEVSNTSSPGGSSRTTKSS